MLSGTLPCYSNQFSIHATIMVFKPLFIAFVLSIQNRIEGDRKARKSSVIQHDTQEAKRPTS